MTHGSILFQGYFELRRPTSYYSGAGSGSDSDKSDESDPEPEATAFAKSMGLIDAAAGTSSRLPPMPSATSSSTLSGRDHLVRNIIHS